MEGRVRVGKKNQGMALALLLLVLLALTLAGHSALLLSRRELQATWAFRNHVRAGDAARIGIELAWGAPPSPSGGRPVWVGETLASGQTEDGLVYEGIRRWLNEEFFLLEGIGRTRGWVGERKMGWVGWSLAPGARMTAFLSAPPTGSGNTVRTLPPLGAQELSRIPTGWDPSECERCRSYLDSVSSELVSPPVLPHEEGNGGDGSRIPSLGLLTGPILLSRSGWAEGMEAEIPARTAGGCPGEGQPAFIGTPGDLVLGAGRLCGFLVTGGSLTVGAHASFQGIALVGGDMILENQANFEGIARVRNKFLPDPGSSFFGSACAVFWTLSNLPILQKPILLQKGIEIDSK